MSRVLPLAGILCAVGAVAASLGWFVLESSPAGRGAAAPPEDAARTGASEEPRDEATDAEPRGPSAPDPVVRGYSGTADARRPGRARAAPAAARAATPAPSPYFAADGDLGSLAKDLGRAATYTDVLRILHRMGGEPRHGDVTERREDGTRLTWTRFQDEPERMASLLDAALATARRGVVRQALLFHLAIALPPEVAFPRLRAFAASADAGDAEDALCALAFSGDEEAFRRFEALAATPDPRALEPELRWIEDADRAFAEGRRDLLRSHRCIETLDRAPYFRIQGLFDVALHREFPWTEGGPPRPSPLVERALPAWLARYPRHAGADDMCWRMARHCASSGREVEAVRWASRGTGVPDGDMRAACRGLLVTIAEFAPPGAPAGEGAIDPAAPERNADLLHYIRVRRRAQQDGFAAAVREMDVVAASRPGSELEAAWSARWSAPVPRGLASGLAPLPADDPLLRVAPPAERRPHDGARGASPFVAPLAAQFRAWETMAALESRRALARGDEALDLLYKEAAVAFHEPRVLYPAYAHRTTNNSSRPETWRLFEEQWDRARETAWIRGALSWELAVERFESLVRTDPRHPLADDALYSAALAHVKAADDLVVCAEGPDERDRHLRAAVDAFARLVAAHPESPLAPSAGAALRHWRSVRKDLF